MLVNIFSRKYAQKVTMASIKEFTWNYAELKSSVLSRVIQSILLLKVKLCLEVIHCACSHEDGHDMWYNQSVCPRTSSATVYELLDPKILILWRSNAISNCQECSNDPTKFAHMSIRLTEIHSAHVHAIAQQLWESASSFELRIWILRTISHMIGPKLISPSNFHFWIKVRFFRALGP